MIDDHDQLATDLSHALFDTFTAFIIKNVKDDINTSDLINATISAHLTSMMNAMRIAAKASDNPAISKRIDKFIETLLEKLASSYPLSTVEIISTKNH